MRCCGTLLVVTLLAGSAGAQPLGEPDRGSPGDQMIRAYLRQETEKLSAGFAADLKSRADWEAKRPQYLEEYFYMLGLSPQPEKTTLHPTVTGSLAGDGYVVEMLHYQSVPQLYVTGNLYRPAETRPGEKLPAVFYVCGHSGRGRNGNKVAYQSHGIWFARHGYVCLVVDTLQLGEIAALHHGTYNLERWWWHSRGYTPAGVEAWNGVRGIDYLISRPDVDPARLAVTGISGGGAATFWVAAADERVKVTVPVSGMADLESYVPNRVINGHCDCMFLYNTFAWPWTRIAGLVAPRPMLFINSDQDRIFPMDANERISNRLERLYSLYGAGDQVGTVVSVGGHAYREDIRKAAYGFINAHLKGDARPITDSEIDIVSEGRDPGPYPIPPEKLRVFPADADLPRDQLNAQIDEQFVPIASVDPPAAGRFDPWKEQLVRELRRVSFRYFPDEIPAAKGLEVSNLSVKRMTSEGGVEFCLRWPNQAANRDANKLLLVVLNADEAGTEPAWLNKVAQPDQAIVFCEPRGIGETKWTRKNGPNYVERSHVLLGRTVDSGRVWDVIAAANYLRARPPAAGEKAAEVSVAGSAAAGLIAAYAAVLEPRIAGVSLIAPPATHMEKAAPQLLNVLRVCDAPHVLGLLAPRPLAISSAEATSFAATVAAYKAAEASDHLQMAP
jgi:cephalosporin-C deacetylase-like acetyl esterase